MTRNFKEAVEHRRTYYNITNNSPISDHEIKELIAFAVKNVPSAFNSQSTRKVLGHHQRSIESYRSGRSF